MIWNCQDRDGTAIVVALEIAVGELRCGFSQIALFDRLAAQRTEGPRSGRPAIQDEFHVPSPNENQLFLLTMYGHARPILVNFRIAPVVLRILASQDAARVNGRRASRANLIAAAGGRSRRSEQDGRDPKHCGRHGHSKRRR